MIMLIVVDHLALSCLEVESSCGSRRVERSQLPDGAISAGIPIQGRRELVLIEADGPHSRRFHRYSWCGQ